MLKTIRELVRGVSRPGAYHMQSINQLEHYQIPFTWQVQRDSADTNNTIPPYRPNTKNVTYLLVLMIITPLMRLKLVNPTVSLLAQFAVERLAGLTGRFCLSIHTIVSIPERRIKEEVVCRVESLKAA